MFSTQLGNFPFATTKIKDNSLPNNLQNKTMETNNGAGDSNQSQIDKTKLIINYIPQFATEDDLAQIFAPIGRVESIKIMRDYKTGYSFGFGFVKYSTPEDAAKAIEVLNGYTFRNKRLKVSYSRPPGTDMKDSNLYITNLPKDITEEEVDSLFRDYGEIVQRTVLKDKVTGMPRGVAFVRYSKGEEAQAAIANLHGKMLENAMLPLSVRVAEDHGRQKAQYLDVWDPMGINRDDEVDPEGELIKAIFQRRPLWNSSSTESEDQKEELWDEVVILFQHKWTLEFLQKKWNLLKEAYVKYCQDIAAYVPNENRPPPTFYYFDAMSFLDVELKKQVASKMSSPTPLGGNPLKKRKQSPIRAPSSTSGAEMGQSSGTESSKADESPPENEEVNGFLRLVKKTLESLPLRVRREVQINILQMLDDVYCH